jgi:hypothetical protein
MKAANGTLLIALAMFVLWIGVTGRFPKLMEAVGIVRGKTTTAPNATPKPSTTSGSDSGSAIEQKYAAATDGGIAKNIIMGNPLVWPGWVGYKSIEAITK